MQDLRRSNFTSADARRANFKGAKLNGAYFIKTVTAYADFTDADVSDVLWDRSVIVEAKLRNAILQRVVFTSSDLTGADIYGADFSNALVDRSQQLKLCRCFSPAYFRLFFARNCLRFLRSVRTALGMLEIPPRLCCHKFQARIEVHGHAPIT